MVGTKGSSGSAQCRSDLFAGWLANICDICDPSLRETAFCPQTFWASAIYTHEDCHDLSRCLILYISPLFFVSHLRFVTDTRNMARSFGASRDTYATRRFHASGFRHSCTQSLGGLLSVPLTRATSPPHTASAEHCTCKKENAKATATRHTWAARHG